jgi:DNA-binding transcriptional LysR family regulator
VQISLKQLDAFYSAATCGNFSVAAEHLHISVSSLSKRVSELESSLGCALFDRSGRSAVLTADGERLLPKAREVLESGAKLVQSMQLSAGIQGSCCFGVSELSAMTWLADLVKKVEAEHPVLQLEPQVGLGQVLEQRLEDGELDFVVIAGPSSRSRLASEMVGQVQFVWAASPKLARAHRGAMERMIETELLVSLPDGAGGTRVLDDWLAKRGLRIGRRLACNSWAAVVGMIVEGAGFGFMPRAWAAQLQTQGALKIIDDPVSMRPLSYAFLWRRGDIRGTVSAMRQLVKEVIDFPAPNCFGAADRRSPRALGRPANAAGSRSK